MNAEFWSKNVIQDHVMLFALFIGNILIFMKDSAWTSHRKFCVRLSNLIYYSNLRVATAESRFDWKNIKQTNNQTRPDEFKRL